jgi:hypothetical protein
MTSPRRRDREQLIGALIPTPLSDRPRPCPAPIPALPAPRPPATGPSDEILIGTARPDHSGRVTARGLLRAVGCRGELPLPVSVRQMCAISPGQPLLLAALTAHDLLVIHPASTVTRLLADLHTQITGDRHDR